MIRYRPDPNGGASFLEASPEDIRGMRRYVRATLWRLNVRGDDAEDFCQNVEFITWKALEEGRIRERERQDPFNCLRSWMRETAWRCAMNERARHRNRFELRRDDELPIEQDARLDARELLAMLTAYPETLALLILLSEGGMRADGATAKGVYLRAYKARRWLRDVRDSGVWREPPGYEKRRPRDRKKGR